MALVWETTRGNTHYCVRSAGRSMRLYSNGVFHSQWNPARPFAGGIWDCLSLPALYLPAGRPLRVLLLGLGGGAGVRQLQTLVELEQLLAIEIDPVHISIAWRWFGVAEQEIVLQQADAIEWMQHYRGPCFDLVIDDLFGHSNAEPERVQALDEAWVAKLAGALDPAGIVVANCIGRGELLKAVPAFAANGFGQAYRWSLAGYDNAVGVFLRQRVASGHWSARLAESSLSPAMQRQARWITRRSLEI